MAATSSVNVRLLMAVGVTTAGRPSRVTPMTPTSTPPTFWMLDGDRACLPLGSDVVAAAEQHRVPTALPCRSLNEISRTRTVLGFVAFSARGFRGGRGDCR